MSVSLRRVLIGTWSVITCVTLARAQELTFEERIRNHEVIERVRYSHQLGTTLFFEDVFPRELLVRRVQKYLRNGAALEQVWGTSVTTEMLREEMTRIQRETRMPQRLVEIYEALGNDPFAIQECLVRPLLTERIFRDSYAFDSGLHSVARESAEVLRARLIDGSLNPFVQLPNRTEIVLDSSQPDAGGGQYELSMSSIRSRTLGKSPTWQGAGEVDWLSDPQSAREGDIGALHETRDGFLLGAVLERRPNEMRIAAYWFAKRKLHDWWEEIEDKIELGEFDPTSVEDIGALDIHGHAPGAAGSNTDQSLAIMGVSLESGANCNIDDTWSPIPTAQNGPSARENHTAVWTGNVMIVWGGAEFIGDTQTLTNTGGVYDPVLNTWTPVSMANAPSARMFHSAVWTGLQMIVWGGEDPIEVNTGGRYNPLTDSWTETAATGVPAARSTHTAVWTGNRMLVWGGIVPSGIGNSGGLYDPAIDAWSLVSLLGAPQSRFFHTAVWTGDQMIIWGGEVPGSGGVTLNTGGRYDPLIGLWIPTSTVNAPTPRELHTAVWSGSKMIVWGGGESIVNHLDTGGVYDPMTDAWASTSTVDAPLARSRHAAVWDGSRMILWGGQAGTFFVPTFFDTGGRYDPNTDIWTGMSTDTAPLPRSRHTTVWTSDQMLVWGGRDRFVNLDDGGEYCTCEEATYYMDADTDSFGDVNTSTQACAAPLGFVSNSTDCNDADATVWGTPSEVQNLLLTDGTTISWMAPSEAGGSMPVYDLLRSSDPADFVTAATCIETDSPSTTSNDTALPAVGSVFTYLPRAETGCPGGGQGSLGSSSDGTPRSGRTCP